MCKCVFMFMCMCVFMCVCVCVCIRVIHGLWIIYSYAPFKILDKV